MIYYELTPMYDGRASFYGKALVFDLGNGISELHSYGTTVAKINRKRHTVVLFPAWDHSATTLRHVKEFLRQYGFNAETRSQIERDYI